MAFPVKKELKTVPANALHAFKEFKKLAKKLPDQNYWSMNDHNKKELVEKFLNNDISIGICLVTLKGGREKEEIVLVNFFKLTTAKEKKLFEEATTRASGVGGVYRILPKNEGKVIFFEEQERGEIYHVAEVG